MYEIFSSVERNKPRILLVENDPVARVSYQAVLMEWGYNPVLAMGTGAALQADAKTKALENRCALALIDLRLADDDDDEDISGLILAKELKERLHPIILSGYDNQTVLRNMMQNHKDIPFIAKHDRRDDFKKVLDTEAAKVTATIRGLVFQKSELLVEIVTSSIGDLVKEYPDQLVDIFAQLFPAANSLRLEKMNSEKPIIIDKTQNSFALKVSEEGLQPVIIKIGPTMLIQQEVLKYNKYIKNLLVGENTAILAYSYLWDIGGIMYVYSPNKEIYIRKI